MKKKKSDKFTLKKICCDKFALKKMFPGGGENFSDKFTLFPPPKKNSQREKKKYILKLSHQQRRFQSLSRTIYPINFSRQNFFLPEIGHPWSRVEKGHAPLD